VLSLKHCLENVTSGCHKETTYSTCQTIGGDTSGTYNSLEFSYWLLTNACFRPS